MKKKILTIGIIAVLIIITNSLSISAQQIRQINNSTNNISSEKCNSDDYITIKGNVKGVIRDFRAYVIIEGVDNNFHL